MDIYIGLDVTAAKDALDILGPPTKPGNWKQETYEAKLDELTAKKLETAHNDLRTGLITGAVALTSEGGTVHTENIDPDTLSDYLVRRVRAGDTICGLGLRYRLMQAVWSGQLRGEAVTLVTLPNHPQLVDGYCALKAERANMLMTEFLDFWEPRAASFVNMDAIVTETKYPDAARQAAIAYGIDKAIMAS